MGCERFHLIGTTVAEEVQRVVPRLKVLRFKSISIPVCCSVLGQTLKSNYLVRMRVNVECVVVGWGPCGADWKQCFPQPSPRQLWLHMELGFSMNELEVQWKALWVPWKNQNKLILHLYLLCLRFLLLLLFQKESESIFHPGCQLGVHLNSFHPNYQLIKKLNVHY